MIQTCGPVLVSYFPFPIVAKKSLEVFGAVLLLSALAAQLDYNYRIFEPLLAFCKCHVIVRKWG